MRTARFSDSEISLQPPGQGPPQDRGPPQTDTPSPCKQDDWHTPVKTLPCPKFRLRVVNISMNIGNGLNFVRVNKASVHRRPTRPLMHHWMASLLLEYCLVSILYWQTVLRINHMLFLKRIIIGWVQKKLNWAFPQSSAPIGRLTSNPRVNCPIKILLSISMYFPHNFKKLNFTYNFSMYKF